MPQREKRSGRNGSRIQEIHAIRAISNEPASVQNAFQAAQAVHLTQAWRESTQVELTNTEVRVAWTPDTLWVRAELNDNDPFTQATSDSQPLWELGDVFEIFLEAEGVAYYVEMHVAPNNLRLHLRFQPGDVVAFRENKAALTQFMICPPRFHSIVQKMAAGWSVEARIPCAEVSPMVQISPGSQWRASFCRYDASSDGQPPILSSTSPHADLNFHRKHEWRPLCF